MADDTRCVQSSARESRPASGAFDRISRSCSCPLPLPVVSRRSGPLDALLAEADRALRVLSGNATAGRPNPASAEELPTALSDGKAPRGGLMRVNHVGEVCAQALYRGQASVCREPAARALLLEAAAEEVDHLVWCNQRLSELGSRPSLLNPSGMPAHSPWAWWPAMPACRATWVSWPKPSGRSKPISMATCRPCRRRTSARARSCAR